MGCNDTILGFGLTELKGEPRQKYEYAKKQAYACPAHLPL